MIPDLSINPGARTERLEIADGQHCLVVDDFFRDPESIVEWVAGQQDRFQFLERSYPGEVLPLSADEAGGLHRYVRSTLSREFGFLRGGLNQQTQFSLTTLQPEDFSWIQRLPHSDPRLEAGRVNYAALIYLFRDEKLGGTGFYRWRDPDFWQQMTAGQTEDPDAGLELLREKFQMFRDAPSYTSHSNEAVELLANVPARFNRLIAYSGDVPHNAFITRPDLLLRDVHRGRLTLNCFASAWPRQA